MTRVIGIGNPMRGDDGAGRAVAARLRALAPGADVVECDGEATRVLALMEGQRAVILVDACVSGAPPGTVHHVSVGRQNLLEDFAPARSSRRSCPPDDPLPQGLQTTSSHGFGLAEAIALARALERLPQDVTVCAIEAQDFTDGAPLSPPVAAAVEDLAQTLAQLALSEAKSEA